MSVLYAMHYLRDLPVLFFFFFFVVVTFFFFFFTDSQHT